MNARDGGVDFDEVRKNAQKQGVDLQTIAIVYSGLTTQEKTTMERENLVTHAESGSGPLIARFRADGTPAFPDKATSVLYLGAD